MQNPRRCSPMVSAAVTGLVAGIATFTAVSSAAPRQEHESGVSQSGSGSGGGNPSKAGPHCCAGRNDCKGLGGCGSSKNGCKGKNDCKGQGGCNTKTGCSRQPCK
jgi:hypothetical protein